MTSTDKSKYIFYCKPNAGLIDAWLPVIARLRKRCDGVEVVMVAYDLRVFLDLSQNVNLMSICNEMISSFYVPVGNRLIGSDKLESVINLARKQNSLVVKMFRSYFPGLANRIRDLLILVFCNSFSRWRILDLVVMVDGVKGLFYDAKFAVDKFPQMLDEIPRYSLPGGYAIIPPSHETAPLSSSVNDLSAALSKRDFVFALNKLEHRFYSQHCPFVNLSPITPPKYEGSWIQYLQGMTDARNYFDGRQYAVLLSKRGGNVWLPKKRRADFIQAVRNVVIDDLGISVVIKLHPVERDVETYFRIFGRTHYGQNWCFSGEHPLGLSVNALFGISFMSSTCIDLLADNVPVIELSNNDGMSDEDKKDHFGEEFKDSSRGYFRDSGLVLGAESEQEFKEMLNYLLADRDKVLDQQKMVLNEFIYHSKSPIDYVCEKIISGSVG